MRFNVNPIGAKAVQWNTTAYDYMCNIWPNVTHICVCASCLNHTHRWHVTRWSELNACGLYAHTNASRTNAMHSSSKSNATHHLIGKVHTKQISICTHTHTHAHGPVCGIACSQFSERRRERWRTRKSVNGNQPTNGARKFCIKLFVFGLFNLVLNRTICIQLGAIVGFI